MSEVVYHIVPHDNGWAYRVEGTFSETFASHDDARAAARRAAAEQLTAGSDAKISWEDARGEWHFEIASGEDRPQTQVEG